MRVIIVDSAGVATIKVLVRPKGNKHADKTANPVKNEYTNSAQGEYILDYLKSILNCK